MPRFERRLPAVEAVDLSIDGLTLVIVRSKPNKKPKIKREVCTSEEAARGELARQIRKLGARGYTTVREPRRAASALLVEELLGEANPRFLEELELFSGKKLLTIADRWSADGRPALRRMLVDYVLGGCDRPGHRLLVKRLLSLAETRGDDELMGCFLVAFDRMEKRWLVERREWDFDIGGLTDVKALVSSPLLASHAKGRPDDDGSVFSTRTRHFLCRRVFRYFRRLAFRKPASYARAVGPAIARFTDADVAEPSKFLDAWSLVHVLYHGSDVLIRDPRGIRVAPGHEISELTFAPLKPEAWSKSFEVAFALARDARSRPVARFATSLLAEHHDGKLKTLSFAQAKELLAAAHEETRAFFVRRLRDVPGLDRLPVGEWLALLESGSLESLPEIVRLFREHVAPRRLSLEECVTLALSPAAPVAELGLAWVKERTAKGLGALERQRLLQLVSARAPLVRAEAGEYLARLLAEAPESKPEEVRELLDASDPAVRARGMALVDEVPRFSKSPIVWASMAESPHPEVREKLLDELAAQARAQPAERRISGAKVTDASLAQLWATTLLAIHRGGRAKPKALLSMAQALVTEPARAESVVPLMRIALRSVRPAERRTALAAITRAAQTHEEVRAAVTKHLPELDLGAIDVEVVA